MKKIVILAAIVISAISCTSESKLAVIKGKTVHYKDKNGASFRASYGHLSDRSLHFVKVTMPDGGQYTLPQLVSASGARYTNERKVIWWEHQGTVRVEIRNADGDWETGYSDLKEE